MTKWTKRLSPVFFILLVSLLIASTIMAGCASSKPTVPASSNPPASSKPATTTSAPPTTTAKPAATTQAATKPYYEGKTITMVIGSGAGGGSDSVARLIAYCLQKHIPGKPNIICRNIGRGFLAPNYVKMNAPKDGTYLLGGGGGIVSVIFLQPPGMEVKYTDLIPLCGTKGGTISIIKPGLLSDPSELVKASEKLSFGYSAPTAGTAIIDCLAMNLLNFRPKKCVWGYEAGSEVHLALMRGEINYSSGSPSWYQTSVKPFVKEGKISPLYESGLPTPDGMTIPSPYFQGENVLTVQQLYEKAYGKKPSGRAWEIYVSTLSAYKTVEKVAFVSSEVPKEVRDILAGAVAEMMKDPEFISMSAKVTGGQEWFYGPSLVDLMAKSLNIDPALMKEIKDYFKNEWGADLSAE